MYESILFYFVKKPMETDDSSNIKTEPTSQTSTTSSTPVPTSAINPLSQTSNATTATTTTAGSTTKTKLPSIVLPEVDLYLHLLVLLFAIDRQKYKQVKRNGFKFELIDRILFFFLE